MTEIEKKEDFNHLFSDKRFFATEKGRLDQWRFLCLSGSEDGAGRYLAWLIEAKLLSPKNFSLFLGSKAKKEFKVSPVVHKRCFEKEGVDYFKQWFRI
jgi:hypothetical protein